MATISAHKATATVALPSVDVPGYELAPGYTTQYPRTSIYHEEFATDLGGWTADGNTAIAVESSAEFGKNVMALRLVREMVGQPAIATKAVDGLEVGRKYWVSMDYSFGGPTEGRSASIKGVTPISGGLLPANPDGSRRAGIEFVATSTSQTFTIRVDGIPNDPAVLFLRGASILRFDLTALATSYWTPPVMQPPTTIPGRTVPLRVKNTRTTLDESWSPYAQARLICYAPSIEILEALDPRKGLRVKVTLAQHWGDEADDWNSFGYRAPVTRTFDLSLRERAVDKVTGEMLLTLEGDEALMLDYALVANAPDYTPLASQASLRAIVNYALGKVGAALSPGDDTHVTVSQSPNLFKNPSGRRGAAFYVPQNGNMGQDVGVDTYVQSVGNFGQGAVGLSLQGFVIGTDIEAHTTYTVSAGLLGVNGTTKALLFATGAVVNGGVTSAPSATGGPFVRRSASFTTTASGTVGVYVLNSGAIATGGIVAFQDAQLERGPVATPYFDSTTPADSKYTYGAQGVPDASPSTRTLVTPRSDQLLDWKPGRSAWEFLQPIVQAAGFRLWCDESRVWHLAKAWNTQNQVNVSPDNGLTSGVDTISRNEAWYDSVVIEYRWTDRAGRQLVEWDIAGVAGNSTLSIEHPDTPFPGKGAAASILRRADGKGRIISPEAINNYLATPGDVVQISLPDSPVQTGLLSNVTWNTPADRMQLGSRALTDTPADAWINAVGPWTAAVGPWMPSPGTN